MQTDEPSQPRPRRRLLRRRRLPRLPRRVRWLKIDVYAGYGTTAELVVTGRLFVDKKLDEANETDSRIRNLIRNSRRFLTDDKAGVWVNGNILGHEAQAQTDSDGLFALSFTDMDLPAGIQPVSVTLAEDTVLKLIGDVGTGQCLVHPIDSRQVGVVSDIDDTIQRTDVKRKLHFLNNVFLKNYKTQLPIPGMNDIFQAIHRGPQGDGYDATHYVSSSPIQLFSRIAMFLKHNGFPDGSIDLKNPGFGKAADSLFEHYHYKLNRIRRIFQTYPQRHYVLFGDSGEKDPEIYSQVASEFPGRVVAVYIHNVSAEDPFSPRFLGQKLFATAGEARQDLLTKGLIV